MNKKRAYRLVIKFSSKSERDKLVKVLARNRAEANRIALRHYPSASAVLPSKEVTYVYS